MNRHCACERETKQNLSWTLLDRKLLEEAGCGARRQHAAGDAGLALLRAAPARGRRPEQAGRGRPAPADAEVEARYRLLRLDRPARSTRCARRSPNSCGANTHRPSSRHAWLAARRRTVVIDEARRPSWWARTS